MTIAGAFARPTAQPALDNSPSDVAEDGVDHEREYHVIRHLGAQHQIKAFQQRTGQVRRRQIRRVEVTGEEDVVLRDVGHTMVPPNGLNGNSDDFIEKSKPRQILTPNTRL